MFEAAVLFVLSLLVHRIVCLTVENVVFLGNVTTSPNDNTVRDNGYSGRIGATIIDTWGDTFQCDDAYHQINCGYPKYYTYTNAAGIEESTTTFRDTPSSSAPGYFCAYFSDEDPATNALGVSNVVPTSATGGVVYTFSYRRNLPGNNPSVGAGLGIVSLSNGVPVRDALVALDLLSKRPHVHGPNTTNRTTDGPSNWWSGLTEPWYGVDSAWLSADGSYIHLLGPANTTNAGGDWLYMARVPVALATDLGSYEYWDGTSWQQGRIVAGPTYALKDTSGNLLTGVGQGQGMYNSYLKQYIYCDRQGLDYNVRCRTSANPQGPWTAPVDIFSSTEIGGCGSLPDYNGETYAASMHPWYDNSEKSFVMWFTCGPNIIQAVNVVSAQYSL